MICAIRRQYSGEVKYCWPVSCWPEATSQRRNSALRRPSGCRVMRPVTSAWALMVFQFWNCGAASMLTIFSMNAAGSIGANNPLRFKLLVMTWETPTLTSPSAGEPETKSGIAIGSGAKLPSVICNFVCAPASEGISKPDAAPAPPSRRSRRDNGNGGSENDVTDIAGSFPKSSTMKHLLGVEIDVHVFPLLVGLVPQHRVGLALQHRSTRGFRRRLVARRASGRDNLGRPGKPAVRVQPDPDRDIEFLGMFDPRLDIPQARQPRPHGVEFGLRQGRRGTARGAERGRGIQRRAGDRLPGRIALVEQGRDLRLIEGALLLRLRRLRRRRLGFRFRHRLLGVFRLQRFRDR